MGLAKWISTTYLPTYLGGTYVGKGTVTCNHLTPDVRKCSEPLGTYLLRQQSTFHVRQPAM